MPHSQSLTPSSRDETSGAVLGDSVLGNWLGHDYGFELL